jgi:dethiobiotin synthetase
MSSQSKFGQLPKLQSPGLFITATDTEVGKTVITCAIAVNLRKAGLQPSVCKPYASGCRRDREGLVSEDAEAIAHFSDCRQALDIITPIRYAPPLAPAVAAEQTGRAPDLDALAHNLKQLDEYGDAMLIEGIGGLLTPLDPEDSNCTVLDLASAIGYPVVVVARAGLGTLNHTAMTVRLLKQAGCKVAGIVINGFVPDMPAEADDPPQDLAMQSNRLWLSRMTRAPILATVPLCKADEVAVHEGILADAIIETVEATYWADVIGPAR